MPPQNRRRFLLVLSLLSLGACGQLGQPTRPNILLISIDTLRADHLGVYGYHRSTSPVFDRLAETSTLYRRALAPTPWTLPSHGAMLTGTHPYLLGIRDRNATIPPETPLLAELLVGAGYQTAAFVNSTEESYLGAKRGFARGFETFEHSPHRVGARFDYDMAHTVERAFEWLDSRDPHQPFFLFLHTKSVHALPRHNASLDERHFPYDKPEPYRFRFARNAGLPYSWCAEGLGCGQNYLWGLNRRLLEGDMHRKDFPRKPLRLLVSLYDAGIFYVDEQLGKLLDGLEERGVHDNSILIVTSDHGEAFLEHNLFMHQEVHDDLLHVPLLVRMPGQQDQIVVEQNVGLADLVPTLLEWLTLETPDTVTGRPLPLSESEPAEIRDFFAYYLNPTRFSYRAFALTRGTKKLVYDNFGSPDTFEAELYDLLTDPREVSPREQPKEEWLAVLDSLIRRPPLAQGEPLIDPRS